MVVRLLNWEQKYLEKFREYDELKKAFEQQAQMIEMLKEQVDYMKRKMFGSSSEQTPVDGQIDIFSQDGEETSIFTEPESTGQQIENKEDKWIRRSKRKNRKAKISDKVPIKKEVIPLGSHSCPICGEELRVLQSRVGERLHYKPAELCRVVTVKEVGFCQLCINNSEAKPISPEVPIHVLAHSNAANDLIAAVIANKYQLALPLDRQRRRFKELGVDISEATLTNWVIISSRCIEPIYQLLFKKLKKQKYLQGDETPIQVINEPGKSRTSKSYLWEVRSIKDAVNPVVYFHYDPSRSQQVAENLYVDFEGILVCDGYTGYNRISDKIIRAGCWAHMRRRVYEAANGIKTGQSLGHQLVVIINQLFRIEDQYKDRSLDELMAVRQTESLPLVQKFWQLINSANALPQSKLGKAVTYALNQRDELEVFLTNPHVPLSNNITERSIKISVIGRKNWLFSTGQRGAKANAIFLTLLETAKANGLRLSKYLLYLFDELPQFRRTLTEEELEAYLPWSPEVQRRCA